ncbi:MAG: nucleoside deaminase [Candidatus Thiodiazotropha sp.]|jgi:guanine deaminase
MEDQDTHFMHAALRLAQRGIELGHGGPFGAIVVSQGRVLGSGWNQVIHLNDPTAHAEMQAIREACQTTHSYHLTDSVLYATCQPCPMCLSAAYWAHIDRLVYAATPEDASAIGFSDEKIERELALPSDLRAMSAKQLLREESLALFRQWQTSEHRIDY